MKNIILADFHAPLDWDFSNELSKNGIEWEVKCCVSNSKFQHTKLGTIWRYFLYFFFPFKFLFIRKRYKYVLGWQQFYAINLAFWLRLFRLRKMNKIIVMTFIYKRKNGWIGRLYHHYINYSISSGHISNIICHSQGEVEYYTNLFHLPTKLVSFIPVGIDAVAKKNVFTNKDARYIFSTGRSNRDYPFLVKSLIDTDYCLKVACEETLKGNEHIEIIHNCYGNDMLDVLKKSYCVCILLQETNVSSGQLVILQAMQFGKPLIITHTESITDYVIDGYNGYIINNKKEELLEKLALLYTDDALYQAMSKNCISFFNENYTLAKMAQNILALIH